jgi:hypothetical protein
MFKNASEPLKHLRIFDPREAISLIDFVAGDQVDFDLPVQTVGIPI